MRLRASAVNKELLDIKTSLVSLEGSINTLHVEMRSGDKDTSSSVKLLAQVVEGQNQTLGEYRRDLKDAVKEFRDSIMLLTQSAASQASAVRVDLEAQLVEHEQSDAPHETTLGARVKKLEAEAIKMRVYGGIVVFLGWGGIAAIV